MNGIIRKHREFFLILILGILVRIVMASGLSGDAYFYSQHAADLMQGKFEMGIQTYVDFYRYAVWMPLALFFRLFGINDFSAILWPLLCGIGSLVTVYLLGIRLFDKKTAWLALFLFAFLSLEVIISTQVMPDVMLEFFSALAILIFLYAESKQEAPGIIYFLAGLSLGVAVNARSSSAVLGAFFILYLFWKKRPGWKYLILAAGMVLLPAITYLVSWMHTGNPFFEYQVHSRIFQGLYQSSLVDPAYQYFSDLLNNWYYPKTLLGLSRLGLAHFSFFFYLFLAAAAFCLLRKRREVIPLWLWIAPAALYLQFGLVDFRKLLFVPHEERYLSLIIIPMVLMTAFFLSQWEKKMPKAKWWIVTGLMIFAASSLYGAYRVKNNSLVDLRPYREVHSCLKNMPRKPIYCVSYKWPLLLNYYFKYTMGYDFFKDRYGSADSYLKLVDGIRKDGSIKDAYVVIHDRYIHFDDYGHPLKKRPELPDYVYSPPGHWKHLKHFYLSGKGNKIDIYSVP